jgi:hypothetical protein
MNRKLAGRKWINARMKGRVSAETQEQMRQTDVIFAVVKNV